MKRPIFVIAVIYGLVETAYFGWNDLPQSPAEVIADGIFCLILALAFIDRSSL